MSKPSVAAKPAALMLAPEPPYPLMGGGALRTASILQFLAQRYDIDLVTFRQPGSPDPAAFLPPGSVRRVTTIPLPPHSKTPAASAVRNLRRWATGVPPLIDRFAGFEPALAAALPEAPYDLAVIEHFWCAPYLPVLAPRARRLVLDLHNVESVWLDRAAAVEPGPGRLLFRRWADRCRCLERDFVPRFTTVLATSEADAAAIRRIAPGAQVSVYPNAIPLVPIPQVQRSHSVVFAGNLEYRPNIAAVRFFYRDIWPTLSRRWPALEWRIVGINPGAIAARFASDSRIRVVGPVPDAVGSIAESEVSIVPLLSGSGTRLKIIESWAAGTPVVSTTTGAEGLSGRAGEHLLIADTPGAFAEAVSKILESQRDGTGAARSLAACARALYQREYTWEAAWDVLRTIGF